MNSPGATRDLAKSDSTTDNFSWVMVTTTEGTLVYDARGGNTVTLAVAPVGVWIPVGSALRIKDASTAVGFMVA